MIYRRLDLVMITHLPTGTTATVDAENFRRNQHKARDAAMSLLRSRLYANAHIKQPDALAASYDLPDGDEYPMELEDFRNPIDNAWKLA